MHKLNVPIGMALWLTLLSVSVKAENCISEDDIKKQIFDIAAERDANENALFQQMLELKQKEKQAHLDAIEVASENARKSNTSIFDSPLTYIGNQITRDDDQNKVASNEQMAANYGQMARTVEMEIEINRNKAASKANALVRAYKQCRNLTEQQK